MIKRILFVGILIQLLITSSVLASTLNSDTCLVLEEGGGSDRYVLLLKNNDFFQYLDKNSIKEDENYLEVRVVAIPVSACLDPENMRRDVGLFAFRDNGTEGKILELEQYQENGEQVRRIDGMVEDSKWESIPPGHPVRDIWEKVRIYLQNR